MSKTLLDRLRQAARDEYYTAARELLNETADQLVIINDQYRNLFSQSTDIQEENDKLRAQLAVVTTFLNSDREDMGVEMFQSDFRKALAAVGAAGVPPVPNNTENPAA